MRGAKPKAEKNIVVGIADMGVTNDRRAHLITYSLGSCLGITIYDPVARVGGMLHAMLPTFETDVKKARATPPMFVDSGLSVMFRTAYRLGAEKSRIVVKVAGGAELLDQDQLFGIGRRNYQTLKETLERNGVALAASAVGGNVTRTVRLDVATGIVTIHTLGHAPFHL
jgi:chemotaxis protein CheD